MAHCIRAVELSNELYIPGTHSLLAASFNNVTVDMPSSHDFEAVYDSYLKASTALWDKPGRPRSVLYENDSNNRATLVHILPKQLNQLLNEAKDKNPIIDDELCSMIKIYKNFGNYLRSCDRLIEARICIEHALELNKNLYNTEEHAEIADCLESLVGVLRDLGYFQEAKRVIVRTVEIRRTLCGSGDFQQSIKARSRLATSLDILGNLLRELGSFTQAREHIEAALEMRKKLFLPHHPNIIISLNSLGDLLRQIGQSAQACTLYKEALTAYGPNFHSLNSLGHTQMDEGLPDEAMEYFTKALNLLQCPTTAHTQKHRQFADIFESIGHCFGSLGKYHQALEKEQHACKIRESYFGQESYQVAACLCDIGLYLHRIGRYNEELEQYERAFSIQKKIFGLDHYVVAKTLDSMGCCLAKLERHTEALAAHQQAIEIQTKVFHAKHPTVAQTLDNIGFCLSYLDRHRLPVPAKFSQIMETLRLNFWVPQMKIQVVEAPHNHPRYFESMIIKGGYTHDLYRESLDKTSMTTFVASRIFKSNQPDKRNIFSVGKISLQCKGTVEVRKGAMIAFPRALIHPQRVLVLC